MYLRLSTHPYDPKTLGYQSCFSKPPPYTVLIPPSTQLIEISDGPSLTIGPSLSWAAWIVRLFWPLNRFQMIQSGDMGAVGCAFGIFDRGEKKTGYRTYL